MIPHFQARLLACVMAGVLVFLGLAHEAFGEQGVTRVMRPVGAGIWYPADPAELQKTMDGLFKDADAAASSNPVSGKLFACIVPHSPYSTFGSIAASTLRLVQPGQYERVIILAPAHHSEFRGCSIPSAQAYVTPLGVVPIDCPSVRELDRLSPLIEVRSLYYGKNVERQQLHEKESTIEVILPYLQQRLGVFMVLPIVVGELTDYHGNMDTYAIDAIATAISRFMDDKTLLVVSSDFTHFGNNFSYRPFKENILEGIEALDKNAFELIVSHNLKGFYDYLAQTENTICGKEAIAVMMRLLPKGVKGTLTGYDISARKSGDTKSSISYAALAFTTPLTEAPVKK